MQQITLLDLLAQDTKRDPFTFYARLREQGPLAYITGLFGQNGAWLATNYDDALTILKDPRFIKDSQQFVPSTNNHESPEESTVISKMLELRRDMLTVDPPDHTRLRRLVSQTFTPRMIERLRPRIQQITDELLDGVQTRGKMDLISDFAFPLPITVISEMLGIPPEDRKQFRIWTQALITSPEEEASQNREEVRLASMEEFFRYIQALLARKREQPGDDMISGLLQARDQGDTLNEHELISTIFLLIVAGHETTVNLIGNGTLALLLHPEQMRLLQNTPSLLPAAIEELLRYTAPVTLSTPRWASEDIPVHGKVIHKGEMVLAALVSANSDPQHFHNSQLLDITRDDNKHLAFGKGIHFCLGAPLARLEGRIAIGTLLRRLPHLHLAEDPKHLLWTRTPILRGLKSLPVTF